MDSHSNFRLGDCVFFCITTISLNVYCHKILVEDLSIKIMMMLVSHIVLICIGSFFIYQPIDVIVLFGCTKMQCVTDNVECCAMKVLLADGQDILPGHKKSRVVIQRLHENADQHAQYLFLQEAAPYRSAVCNVSFSREVFEPWMSS